MAYDIYAPIQMVRFIKNQFIRLKVDNPPDEVLCDISEMVIDILKQKEHFPRTPSEGRWRFDNPQTGLLEEEKKLLLTPIEYTVRLKHNVDFNIIHLTTWAAMMWCWSEEGEYYVRHTGKSYSESASAQRQRFQASLHQTSGNGFRSCY